jgi:hypothetical protein
MSTGYLVQGLRNNTLVAGKTTALRLVTAPWPGSGAAAVQATVFRPDGSFATFTWVAAQLRIVDVGRATESVVALIPGSRLPDVGTYYVRAIILTAIGSVAATYAIDAVQLLPTKDLMKSHASSSRKVLNVARLFGSAISFDARWRT